MFAHHASLLGYEIKQGKKVDPYNVYKMPVQSGVFEFHEILPVDYFTRGENQRTHNDADPNENVKTVKACHNIIEAEEDDLPSVQMHQERGIRINSMMDMRTPLNVLIDEKNHA